MKTNVQVMSKKEELLSAIKADSYSGFILKGLFIKYGGSYYPLRICLLATKNKDISPKYRDYGDLLFVEDMLTIENAVRFIQELGEVHEYSLPPYSLMIPRGFFRALEEDQDKIAKEYRGYQSLQDLERELLKEKRSYPKSQYRRWPTEVFIFNLAVENEFGIFRSRLNDKPFPFKKDLPVFPDYYTALESWFGKEQRYLNEGRLIFYIPKYHARISNIIFAKDKFIVNLEKSPSAKGEIAAKYFIGYENLPDDFGELNFNNENQISLKDKVRKFYVVLFSIKGESRPLDYRNYDFRSGYQSELDFEYEDDNIEYWIAEGENESIEFKVFIDENDQKEFIESVCAFLNTSGGRIILGVDAKGNVKGLGEAQLSKYKTKIPDLIRRWIEPQALLTMNVAEAKGKALIIVSVQRGDKPPYNYKDHGVYIRAGATDRVASREELLELHAQGNAQQIN